MASPLEILLKGNLDQRATQALAEGLRRRKDISHLSVLSGDQTLQGFGSGLGEDVNRQAASKQRMDEQSALNKYRQDSMDLTKGYYEQMAAQSALANTMAQRRQAEIERHNREMEKRYVATSEKTLNDGVRKLSESLTRANVPELTSSISTLDEELKAYTGEGDLPGIGATGKTPTLLLTEDGKAMRNRLSRIKNIILKARSGAAVTEPEADRLEEEFSMKIGYTDQDFMRAWSDLKNSIENGIANIYAGYPEEVVQQYIHNIGRQSGSGVEQPSGKPEAPGVAAPPAPAPTSVKWGDL